MSYCDLDDLDNATDRTHIKHTILEVPAFTGAQYSLETVKMEFSKKLNVIEIFIHSLTYLKTFGIIHYICYIH